MHWKKIVYTMAAIQVGTGITIIGVVSFIPLFLTSELGVTDPGEAAFWAGLISGVTPFFVALAAPVWSMEADKKGQRFALSMILLILSISIAAMYFVKTPMELLVLRMVQGMSGGFVAVGMSMVMNVTPKEKLTWSMGVFQAAMVMGVMFGPLAGGIIADFLGYRMPFAIFSILALLCLAATMMELPKQTAVTAGAKRESFLTHLKSFIKNPVIRLMVLLQFLCNCGMTGIGPILPLYIKDMMGGEAMAVASIVGIIIFVAGGTSVTASLQVSRLTQWWSMTTILIGASLVTACNFILQYLMPTVWTLGFMRGLTGFSLGFIMPLANTILASSVAPEKRTMVVGFSTSFSLMGNVAGPIASGAIAMHFGYGMVFWSTALCFVLAAGVIYHEREKLLVVG